MRPLLSSMKCWCTQSGPTRGASSTGAAFIQVDVQLPPMNCWVSQSSAVTSCPWWQQEESRSNLVGQNAKPLMAVFPLQDESSGLELHCEERTQTGNQEARNISVWPWPTRTTATWAGLSSPLSICTQTRKYWHAGNSYVLMNLVLHIIMLGDITGQQLDIHYTTFNHHSCQCFWRVRLKGLQQINAHITDTP